MNAAPTDDRFRAFRQPPPEPVDKSRLGALPDPTRPSPTG